MYILMCLIITIYMLFINAYCISSVASFYIDLITFDVNLNHCLSFFVGGQMSQGGGGGKCRVEGKCRGGHMSGYRQNKCTFLSLSNIIEVGFFILSSLVTCNFFHYTHNS